MKEDQYSDSSNELCPLTVQLNFELNILHSFFDEILLD